MRGADVLRAVDFAAFFAVLALAGLRFVAVVAMLSPLLAQANHLHREGIMAESKDQGASESFEAFSERILKGAADALHVRYEVLTEEIDRFTRQQSIDVDRLGLHLGVYKTIADDQAMYRRRVISALTTLPVNEAVKALAKSLESDSSSPLRDQIVQEQEVRN